MTKPQYAAAYARCADDLYRFASLVLGEERAAAEAVTAAFRGGWTQLDACAGEPTTALLRCLWRECARRVLGRPVRGRPAAVPVELVPLYWDERGLLLLGALFDLSADEMADVTDLPTRRIERCLGMAVERLCAAEAADAADAANRQAVG